MADGSITFSTRIDNSEVKKGLDAAKREIGRATKSLEGAKNAKMPLAEQAKQLGATLDEARSKLAALEQEARNTQSVLDGRTPHREFSPESYDAYMGAWERKSKIDADIAEQKKAIHSLEKDWGQVNGKVEKYDQKIEQATAEISEQKEKVRALSAQLSPDAGSMKSVEKATAGAATNASSMAEATKRASVAAGHFQKRIVGLVKRVFVFGLVLRALRATLEYIGKALKANEQFNAELARLKGALLTALQSISEVLLPALLAIMRIATAVAQVIAHVFARISGKSASVYAANAKALYEQANATAELGKAAKKTQRSLAAFDEINKLDNTEEDETPVIAASAPNFSDFDTETFQQTIDELTVYISAAALVLGVILLLSGANIPLGLGLIALGAIGLATEIKEDWDTVKRILEEKAGLIAGISAVLLIIGMALAFSGANIPLGIGLMAVGAVGLAAVAAVNWDTISQALQGPIGVITAVTSVLLLAIGLVLVFTGVGVPLGLRTILAGAAGLATTVAANWDSIVKFMETPLGQIIKLAGKLVLGIMLVCTGVSIPLGIALIVDAVAGIVQEASVNGDEIVRQISGVWDSIKKWWDDNVAQVFTKKYWADKFSVIKDALPESWKSAINEVIELVNKFIGWMNDKLHLKWDAFTIGGYEIAPAVDYQLFSFPKSPYLAQGAVLPANKPFLAMVGDQKHGTNVEAPLATIQEAVAVVMEDMIASNMAGHEATVAVLREILSAVLGIEVGDTVIGQAVERYNRQMSVIRGGV